MEEKEKPQLSHTVSLPSSQEQPAPVEEDIKSKRSKSVRQKTQQQKVWSFGDMAKAVGCGMTAFGNNVVSGSKVVSSGVYNQSKVVSSNVVEGTKAATRVTKDVTLAAGKGVAQASAMVGDAAVSTVQVGKDVTSASVSAVQDTTKWVIEQVEQENLTVHTVMPGETVQDICSTYSVTDQQMIRVNSLMSRYLYPGKELVIPTKEMSICPHPFEKLIVQVVTNNSEERRGAVEFGPNDIIVSEEPYLVDDIKAVEVTNILDDAMPKLLTPEELHAPEHFESCESPSQIRICITFLEEEKPPLEYILSEKDSVYDIVKFLDLWQPRLLQNNLTSEDPTAFTSETHTISNILSSEKINALSKYFPNETILPQMTLVYSVLKDGFSLLNFYRHVELIESPVLLVVQDATGDIFGAYLTCTPMITEEFIGTGESWLFFVTQDGQVKICQWSKENEYFFQGKRNCLIIGAEGGNFGIFIDGDMNHGRIDQCSTFVGWPKESKDFKVSKLECFGFRTMPPLDVKM